MNLRQLRYFIKVVAMGNLSRAAEQLHIAQPALGMPGPQNAAPGPSTINGNRQRGAGILYNELYIGKLVWNSLRYIKDADTGKRIFRLNSEDQWITKTGMARPPCRSRCLTSMLAKPNSRRIWKVSKMSR